MVTYISGSKYVYNENKGKEVDLEDAPFYLDWTVTITEPAALTEAVLKDDYSSNNDYKVHTLEVNAEHPMTIIAGDYEITITDLSDYSDYITVNENAGTFEINMIELFKKEYGITSFAGGTTFLVRYSTYATADSIVNNGAVVEGDYYNGATWEFDGTAGKTDNVYGGDAYTGLKTAEYADGDKVAYYDGTKLTSGKFQVDDSLTKIDYVASICQDEKVNTITYTDDWKNNAVKLCYPITVTDNNGETIAIFNAADGSLLTVSDTGFELKLVTEGGKVLGTNAAYVPGTKYYINYSLDFSGIAGATDYSDVRVKNKGTWKMTGNLPDHTSITPTDNRPTSPEWVDIAKDATQVHYQGTSGGELLVETGSESNNWLSEDYVDGAGTFYIDYDVTICEPRTLTSLTLTDATTIPSSSGSLSDILTSVYNGSDGSTTNGVNGTLVIYDEDGNVATYADLCSGAENGATEAAFEGVVGNNDFEVLKSDKLGFDFDVTSYLESVLGGTVSIPKNYTVKLSFQIALNDELDTGHNRVGTTWNNKITATLNGSSEKESEVDTKIQTVVALEKAFYTDDGTTEEEQADGAELAPGTRVKYVITVGREGETFESAYTVTDTMTNPWVQVLDTASIKGYTGEGEDENSLLDATPVITYTDWTKSTPSGFTYTIPAGTQGPVYIIYYVTNITQDKADELNADSDSSNNVYGKITETNTVSAPDSKTDTTTYDVVYESGHTLSKNFKKWDKESGTAYWTVAVEALSSMDVKFPAGYKISEDVFKYSSTVPTGDGGTWTENDLSSASDMTLDLSSVIVMYGTMTLTRGTDYKVEGNTIVLLKDFGSTYDSTTTLKVTNIKTAIPDWNADSTTTLYYYNDASFRTDTDSVLGEDDAQETTDAVAILQKKLVEYDSETGKFTWSIIITVPETGINGWKINDTDYYIIDSNSNMVYLSVYEDAVITLSDGTVLVKGTDYSGDRFGISSGDYIEFKKDFKGETITITFILYDSSQNHAVANLDKFDVTNTATLYDNNSHEVDKKTARETIEQTDIGIEKTSSGTGKTIEADNTSYTALETCDDVVEYNVVINGSKNLTSNTPVTFEDLLPEGFKLVDYNGDSTQEIPRIEMVASFYYDNSDSNSTWIEHETFDVHRTLPYNPNNSSEALIPVTVTTDSTTGREKITINNLSVFGYNEGTSITLKYKAQPGTALQNELKSLTNGMIQYFDNTATVTTGSRKGTATETVVYQYDEALDKQDVSESGEYGDVSTGDITYEIYVNNEQDKNGKYTPRLLNNHKVLQLSDYIPTSVELNRSKIAVYIDEGNNGEWTLLGEEDAEGNIISNLTTDEMDIKRKSHFGMSYDSDTRKLTFLLADQTHYKVVIPCWAEDPTEDINDDGEINQADAEANSYYANTATLVGEGKFEDSTDEKHLVQSSGGEISDVPLQGFRIEKYDTVNPSQNLEGAEFQLYLVDSYTTDFSPAAKTDFVIPDRSTWTLLTNEGGNASSEEGTYATDSDGEVSWDNLMFTTPNPNADENGWHADESSGIRVYLYAWIETKAADGYAVGNNSEPHYFILYYTAKSRDDIAAGMNENDGEFGSDALDDATGKVSYDLLNPADKAAVDAEYDREMLKAKSSYELTAAYDSQYQVANFITVKSGRLDYTWPVGNSKLVNKTVTKLWDDDNNAANARPAADAIKVQLYRDGSPCGEEVSLLDTSMSATDTEYSYTWTNLDALDEDGNEYTYTVEETVTIDNYTATYSADTFTITNHYKSNTTASGTKVWDDNNNAESKRPTRIYFTLYRIDNNNPSAEAVEISTQEGNYGNGYAVSWSGLAAVDDVDDPTTTYSYMVVETLAVDAQGVWYMYDEETGKLVEATYTRKPVVNDGYLTTKVSSLGFAAKDGGKAIYKVSSENDENVYTITNSVISSKNGSLQVSKSLTGLTGSHSRTDVDGDSTTTDDTADVKEYHFILYNAEGEEIVADKDKANSTENLAIYTYNGVAQYAYDGETDTYTATTPATTFTFSEKQAVRIDGLPVTEYTVKEVTTNTSGEMDIDGYTFDTNSVTTATVSLTAQADPANPTNPDEAEIVNNYIPFKGKLSLTKTVEGLPGDVDLTAYTYPVTISVIGDADGTDTKYYFTRNGTFTSTFSNACVHYVTPAEYYTIEEVPVGRYTVTELYEDSTRMPSLIESGSALAHYKLDTDSSTLELDVKISKNNTTTGTLINTYTSSGKLTVDKIIMFDEKELTVSEFESLDESVQTALKALKFTVKNFTSNKEIATFTYDDILAAKKEGNEYSIEVPFGYYTVTESDASLENYELTTTWTVDGAEAARGLIEVREANAESANVTVTNAYGNSSTSITIKKVDDYGNALAGAKFQLTKDGEIYQVNGQNEFTIDGDKASILIEELKAGKYVLTEIEPPENYGKIAGSITFKIADDNKTITVVAEDVPDGVTFTNGTETIAESDGNLVNDTGDGVITVKNVQTVALPSTGGSGTMVMYLLGFLLVVFGTTGFFLIKRKEMV